MVEFGIGLRSPLFHRTRTKFTHYSPEWTGQIKCHIRYSIAASAHCHINANGVWIYMLATVTRLAKSCHITHTMAKNSFIANLNEHCVNSSTELAC